MNENDEERRERASTLFRLRNQALERVDRGDPKAVPLLRAATAMLEEQERASGARTDDHPGPAREPS
jgi:hypothetical protein